MQSCNQSQVQTISDIGNADFTVTISGHIVIMEETPLTGVRTITLPSNNRDGDTLRVVRSTASTGVSALNVGGIKNLGVGTWVELTFVKTAWKETGYGSL
jgi:hypothetical protein